MPLALRFPAEEDAVLHWIFGDPPNRRYVGGNDSYGGVLFHGG